MLPRKLVPDSFLVPESVEAAGFRLVPLSPALLAKDYEAYMSSVEHLKGHLQPGSTWPEGTTLEDALIDLCWVEQERRYRSSFAYAAMTPDESQELGCVYVYPTPKAGFEAEVNLWVRKSAYEKGLDAELYRFAKRWVAEAWPFKRVAFPGREIPWAEWERLADKEPMRL